VNGIVLGRTFGGRKASFAKKMFSAGVLCIGNTNAGKSTLLLTLLPLLAATGVIVHVGDFFKQDMRALIPRFRAVGRSIAVLRPKDFCWNLLQVPSGEPSIHLTLVCDLLARVMDIPSRAQVLLRRAVHDLYEEFGVWRGSVASWPTLFDLHRAAFRAKSWNAAGREALLDRLGSLLLSLTPQVAGYRVGWTHLDLAKHSCVFEMGGAAERVKHILLLPFVLGEFAHRMRSGVANRALDLCVILDDSQRFVVESQGLGRGSLPPLIEMAGLVRGAGISLGISAQSFQGFPAGLIENLSLKIMGRLGSDDDWRRMARELGLSHEQRAWAELQLTPGRFITRLPLGPWRKPFPFIVQPLRRLPRVTDAEVKASQAPRRTIPTLFAEEYRHWTPYEAETELRTKPRATPESASQSDQVDELSEIELRFLRLIVLEPGLSASTYARRMNLRGSRAKALRESLVRRSYVRVHSLATSGRGRPSIVVEPLAKARAALEQAG